MGTIADSFCAAVILTNEDPGDEDPQTILNALASKMKRKPEMILDRRLAIRRAFALAQKNDAVLITGKGTDPWIYGPNGTKIPWSDAQVAREELEKLLRG
jgi:UDP-N-acetylmuramoyl-L-alanyl-D-glutamate--2,6-diaminopimelate ligase